MKMVLKNNQCKRQSLIEKIKTRLKRMFCRHIWLKVCQGDPECTGFSQGCVNCKDCIELCFLCGKERRK